MNRIIFAISLLLLLVSFERCKKGKDPVTVTIKVEATCAYSVNYNIYYGTKYNPYYYTGVGNSEKYLKMYDGDHMIIKAYKNSGGIDANPVKVTLLEGTTIIGSNSSSKDNEEILLDYTY